MIGLLVRIGVAVVAASTLAGATVAASARESGQAAAPERRPNIVLIVTDDQRWDTVWAMPVVTEVLGGHGVTFANSFVVNPLCCPSRANLLTGAYAHTTGVYANSGPNGGYAAFRDSNTIATALDRVDYTTALFGKYLNGYGVDGKPRTRRVPPGWDDWAAFWGGNDYYGYTLAERNRLVRYGDDRDDYSTSVLARKAVSFVAHAKEPFFLEFAPYAPHAPAVPPPGHEGAFDDFSWWKPPSFDEPDVRDKPRFVQELGRLSPAQRRFATRFRRLQLAATLAVDEAVYSIAKTLESRGVLGKTVIVFTSDNGLAWGAHRLTARSKWVAYEEAIRVPLIVRYDRLLRQQPRHDARLVLNIDIAPTVAELAGTTLPGAEGRSLVPLLRTADTRPWRKDFLVEHLAGPNQQGVPTYCAVRTARHKYVVYATGQVELYDLIRDPHELINIAGRPSSRSLAKTLQARVTTLCRPPPPGFDPVQAASAR